jgi:hypothetical protein
VGAARAIETDYLVWRGEALKAARRKTDASSSVAA